MNTLYTLNDIDSINGTWYLVRRVSPSHIGMHPVTDSLYGNIKYGRYSSPGSNSTFSVKFNEYDYDEFLFTTGDCSHWLICYKKMLEQTAGGPILKIITLSHKNKYPYKVIWFNRKLDEDPWISYDDHFTNNCGTILYGENSWYNNKSNHNLLRKTHNGLNVWIRKRKSPINLDENIQNIHISKLSYLPISNIDSNNGTWYLVRRVSNSHKGMHPSKDRLIGMDEYGEIPNDSISDITFSVKWYNIDFNEFMFSTGNMKYWLICSRDEGIKMTGNNCLKTIIKTHKSDISYTTNWMARSGCPEDPWISFKGHFDDNHSTILYGGNSWTSSRNTCQHEKLKHENNGLNVWIRNTNAKKLPKSARKIV